MLVEQRMVKRRKCIYYSLIDKNCEAKIMKGI